MNYSSALWRPARVRTRPPRPPTQPRSSELGEVSVIDFGAFPPEINSGRMYAGPGAGSMLAAAAGWNGLAAELESAASSFGSVVLALTSGPWVGPSSTAMAAAAAPYVAWMGATAQQARSEERRVG